MIRVLGKKYLIIWAHACYICTSYAKELKGQKYPAGAASILSLDIRCSFLELHRGLKKQS